MLRFTIRDLLWLTVVAALAAGWYIDRKATARQRLVERDQFLDGMQKMMSTMTPEQRGHYEKTLSPQHANK